MAAAVAAAAMIESFSANGEEPDAAVEKSQNRFWTVASTTGVSAGPKSFSMLQVKNPESLRIGVKLRKPHRGGILVEK